MSKPLTISATLSVLAMAALAFGAVLSAPERSSATARGPLVSVWLQS